VQTVESLRDIVWFLDPAGDNLGDLILRMKDTAAAMLHGIPFEFRSTGSMASAVPPLELRRNIIPIFKEILHNIAKHAHATKVEISVEIMPGQFRLWVRDDGVGFDESRTYGGNGLRNLRRRAAELGGEVHIESRAGRGTGVTLLAPITRTRGMRGPRTVLAWAKLLGTRLKRIQDEPENR
jgi:signal transduction histidine kinase